MLPLISLKKLQEKFNHVGISVDIKEEDVNFFDIDGISLYYDEYTYIYKRQKTSRYGWIVGYSKTIPGSRWEPDDVDFIEDSHYDNLNQAIARVCALLIEQKLQQFDECSLGLDDFL